jgi:hypothetical protein
MTAPSEWLSPKEAAPLLGESEDSVRILCVDERIRHRRKPLPKGGIRYLISTADIEQYIASQIVPARRR